MKTPIRILATAATALLIAACQKSETTTTTAADDAPATPGSGQSAVVDEVSQPDIVKIAVGSPDHTTLVTAVKAAELVDTLTNAGPFTVFAPTNAAFDKLPAGTVENLLKPENKDKLSDILQYHVLIGGYPAERLSDGATIGTAGGPAVKISVVDGKVVVNGSATVIGTVDASNGIVHVVDGVLLPQ